MINTYRIILSLLTIIVVVVATTSTTYAYFTSTQTISGNIISLGSLLFETKMTDQYGEIVQSLVENNYAPGKTIVRCLFIKNTGTLTGRFKVYRGSDSGNMPLGQALSVRGTLNPTTGVCADLNVSGFESLDQVGSRNETNTVLMKSQEFGNITETPFRLNQNSDPLTPNTYAVLALEITLRASITSNDISGFGSYNTDLIVFGMQEEGAREW